MIFYFLNIFDRKGNLKEYPYWILKMYPLILILSSLMDWVMIEDIIEKYIFLVSNFFIKDEERNYLSSVVLEKEEMNTCMI